MLEESGHYTYFVLRNEQNEQNWKYESRLTLVCQMTCAVVINDDGLAGRGGRPDFNHEL